MDKKNHIIVDLEHLLKTTPFDQLSAEVKREVLAEVSEEEYGLMRQTLLQSTSCFSRSAQQLTPDPAILSSLRERVVIKRSSLWQKVRYVFTYPIPAYQAAAAIVLLGIGLNWMDPSAQHTAINGAEYNMIVDTAFIPTSPVSYDLAGEDSVYKMVSPRD
ncbi:MAG: hypothetical protein AAF824_04460 [Bacteroidota bacterium]